MQNKDSDKTNHYIYKTTLLNSEKYYIGRHSTNNLDDGYMGSGKWVKSIVDKSRLNREILCMCNTCEELLIAEERYIKEHIEDSNCMNMLCSSDGFKPGQYVGNKNPNWGKPKSEQTKKKISDAQKGKHAGDKNPMYGKKLSKKTKDKQADAKRGENSVTAKLTESEVLEIRKLCSDSSISQKELAIQYKVSRPNISNILARRTWQHI